MYRMLGYTEQRPTLPMVMGLTGNAFRISVVRDGVNIGGDGLLVPKTIMDYFV
ncbi:hypothetical protein [Paenibacillus eucommiae]|uniref:Uncharacterized protein n=1 Tax=Paenibacillus eucommiae TaxID=1355755 RepID=A0ABS4IWF2_9BACL|nr:hypothetical protein [Paenibacillus eucommiae]MBP1991181.1 hypothetical protein [Paenibacillus eucommiae]